MLQDKYAKDKFFTSIYHLTDEMDPELGQIDQLLEDEALYQLLRTDFAKRYPHTERTGRHSTPVEVVLRMLTVKRLYGWSYAETEKRVRDSLVLRMFCRVYFEAVPDDTTLIRYANLVQPETLEHYNRRVSHLAQTLKVTQGRKLRTDGTVVETHIHPPTDSQQLVDCVQVLGRTLRRAKAVVGAGAELAQAVFRTRTRSARQTARQVGEYMGAQKERGQQAYRKLVEITRHTVAQAQRVLATLKKSGERQAAQLAKTLETFMPRAEQVLAQTVRRVFDHEKVPAGDKLVSIFEPHSAIIARGKAGKPVEYGHKVWFDEVEGGLVTRWKVLEGNPNDKLQWVDSLETHEALFGRPPTQASADRGVYSHANEQAALDRGIQRVVLPKSGYKSEARKQHEHQAWFRQGRKWHNGIEGRISVLKRRFGLTRCLDHGEDGFNRCVGWAVIANNLTSIARQQLAKAG